MQKQPRAIANPNVFTGVTSRDLREKLHSPGGQAQRAAPRAWQEYVLDGGAEGGDDPDDVGAHDLSLDDITGDDDLS